MSADAWRLKDARSLFFDREGDHGASDFWRDLSERAPEGSRAARLRWVTPAWNGNAPESRSNCPELHQAMEMLIRLAGPRWRARASNIYAGRSTSTSHLAYAQQNPKGGVIVVSLDYSLAIAVHVATFRSFVELLDQRDTLSQEELHVRLEMLRHAFSTRVVDATTEDLVAVASQLADMTEATEPEARAVEDIVRWSEVWVVAHELAHHLVRHMSSRRDRETERLLDQLLAQPAVAREIVGLSAPQRQEIQADVLATLIVSGHFVDEEAQELVAIAATAAIMALLTVGHLHGEWQHDSADEHPGILTRIAVVAKVLVLEHGELAFDDDPRGRTLPRLLALLAAYAFWLGRLGSPELSSGWAQLLTIAELATALAILEPQSATRLFDLVTIEDLGGDADQELC